MKNGISSELSRPRHTDVPLLGTVIVMNGQDFMYQALGGRGYPVSPPPARLPAMHKGWSALNDDMARFIAVHPSARARPPRVTIATGDYLISNTRLQLAHVLAFRRPLQAGLMRPAPTVEGYRSQLAAAAGNVVVMAEPPPATQFPMDGLKLAAAALQLGFREARTFTAPDGRRVFVWWRRA